MRMRAERSNGRLKENTEIRKGIARHPGLQVADIRVSIKICSYSYENKLYKTRKKDTVFMIA